MILSGASAYLVNEANLLDTIFLLYLKGPLINEGPLGAGQGGGRTRGQHGEACCW